MRADPETLDLLTEEPLPPPRPRERVTVFIPIAAGARQVRCTCGDFIFWGVHPTTHNPHPVSMKHAQAIAPTSTTWGQGITHYADCPHKDMHRKKARNRLMRIRRFGRDD